MRLVEYIDNRVQLENLLVNEARRQTAPTLQTLFDQWSELHGKTLRSWPEVLRMYRRHLSPWGRRRLTEINTVEVGALQLEISRGHGIYVANRTIDLLRTLFNNAESLLGWHCERNPAKIRHFPERSRERFLTVPEAQSLLAAIELEEPFWRTYWTCAFWTGQRKSSLVRMRWADLHLADRFWLIPAEFSKNKRQITVALLPRVVKALEALRSYRENRQPDPPKKFRMSALRRADPDSLSPRQRAVRHWLDATGFRFDLGDGAKIEEGHSNPELPQSDWVFATRSSTGHLSEIKSAWTRIKAAAGITDPAVIPYTLRHSLASYLAISGIGQPIIAAVLGHANWRSTQRYAHLNVEAVQGALSRMAAALLAAMPAQTQPKGSKDDESKTENSSNESGGHLG
jgi:integrase